MRSFYALMTLLFTVSSVLFAQPDNDSVLYYTDDANLASWEASAVYQALEASKAPDIDGDPTDAAWSGVHWLPFQVVTSDGGGSVERSKFYRNRSDLHAAVKITWDDDGLYILFRYVDDTAQYTLDHKGWYIWNSKFHPVDFDATTVQYPDGVTEQGSNGWWALDAVEYYLLQNPDIKTLDSWDRFRDTVLVFNALYPHHTVNDESLGLIRDLNFAGNETQGSSAIQYKTAAKSVSGDTIFVEIQDVAWADMWVNQGYEPKVNDTIRLGMQIGDADEGIGAKEAKLRLRCVNDEPRINRDEMVKVALVDEVTMPSYYSHLPLSVKNIYTEQFNLYPNPANESFSLNRLSNIQIYNVSGQLEMELDNVYRNIDISSLQRGIYFVKDDEGNVRKLMVE
ncbi:MAG: T9SS type A sorting domain-containing protein [Bacteroidales bacterium]|nr:T9SS type A sorting domain-containing protein [Bacteroidales bacterium]